MIKIHSKTFRIMFMSLLVCVFIGSILFFVRPVKVISGSLAYMSMDELMKTSPVIVKGKITGHSDSFLVKSVSGGDPVHMTDYYLKVDTVMRGQEINDTISIRTLGGSSILLTTVSDAEATFIVGKSYILFLEKPYMGAAYNTIGDYYYVRGLKQGAFTEQEDGIFISQSGSNETIDSSEFEREIRTLTENAEINDTVYRDTFLNNLHANLESGWINQEEYDRMLAEIEVYATVQR